MVKHLLRYLLPCSARFSTNILNTVPKIRALAATDMAEWVQTLSINILTLCIAGLLLKRLNLSP